jgi:site-specific DNA recombinase
MTATRAAIYTRISLDATGERLGVDRQREDCRKIAADRGWKIVEEYEDNSVSASDVKKSRPHYNRMWQDFQDGKFDALICWDLDRLTRQPRQLEDWIDAAVDRGLRLVTANGEADLQTDGGRMFARIKASVARGEIERKGARQRRALQQRAEQGRPPLGVRLTGYTTTGEEVPEEAALVREIFAQFAAGESLRGITRWLTENGHETRRGRAWSPSTVSGILTNPRYTGQVRYRGEILSAEALWKPLVTSDQFALVQHRLNDPRRKTNRHGTDRKHLGSGLYRCECGKPVTSWSGLRYRCELGCYSRSAASVDAFLVGGSINGQDVRGVIVERLARADLTDVLPTKGQGQRAADLLSESRRLRDRLATIESDYDAGYIDGRRFGLATEKVSAEFQAVEQERARLLAGTAPASVLTAKDPVAAFRSASLMVQRATVDFLAAVTLRPAPRGSKRFDPESVRVLWRAEAPV